MDFKSDLDVFRFLDKNEFVMVPSTDDEEVAEDDWVKFRAYIKKRLHPK
jgi:hypothetical protein